MMNDVFIEERVIHALSRNERFYRALALVAGFGVAVIAAFLLPLFLLISLGVIALTVWGVRRYLKLLNREYEYAFTNGELDIDVIYNKEWRKRLYSLDLRKDLVAMVRADTPEAEQRMGRLARVVNVGRGCVDGRTRLMIIRRDGKELGLLWDPSEKLFAACRRAAPRQVEGD